MSKERNKKIESSILEYLGSHEKLLTRDAIQLFDLSESTIRRIFGRLEEKGALFLPSLTITITTISSSRK